MTVQISVIGTLDDLAWAALLRAIDRHFETRVSSEPHGAGVILHVPAPQDQALAGVRLYAEPLGLSVEPVRVILRRPAWAGGGR